MTGNEALELMRQAGAWAEGHYLMRSGRHADAYLQSARLIEHADVTAKLCAALAEKCDPEGVDLVIGPALGGMIFGYEVSRLLHKHFMFCERKDGVMTLRRGFEIPSGARVLVVEDTVTTGGSIREVIEIVRALGGKVVQVAALINRAEDNVTFGVPFVWLTKVNVSFYPADQCPLCAQGVPISPSKTKG